MVSDAFAVELHTKGYQSHDPSDQRLDLLRSLVRLDERAGYIGRDIEASYGAAGVTKFLRDEASRLETELGWSGLMSPPIVGVNAVAMNSDFNLTVVAGEVALTIPTSVDISGYRF